MNDDLQVAFELVSRISDRLAADETHRDLRQAVQRYFGAAHASTFALDDNGPASSRRF